MKFLAIAFLAIVAVSAVSARKCWVVTPKPDTPATTPEVVEGTTPEVVEETTRGHHGSCKLDAIIAAFISILNGEGIRDTAAAFVADIKECLESMGFHFGDADIASGIGSLFNVFAQFIEVLMRDDSNEEEINAAADDYFKAWYDIIDLMTGGNAKAFFAAGEKEDGPTYTFVQLYNSQKIAFAEFAKTPRSAYNFVKGGFKNFGSLIIAFMDGASKFRISQASTLVS